ncbi:hypothetical protein ACFWWB_29305 [Streptomyces sp. NPDC058690]|uniref:hypothetical protein n=1 Tax=Streptomyces sp. NPDC058690 TaxID=3346600 RepID=UPI003660A1CE
MPIPGTRSPKRVEENTRAADLTLTDTDLAALSESCRTAASAPATARITRPPVAVVSGGRQGDGGHHGASGQDGARNTADGYRYRHR